MAENRGRGSTLLYTRLHAIRQKNRGTCPVYTSNLSFAKCGTIKFRVLCCRLTAGDSKIDSKIEDERLQRNQKELQLALFAVFSVVDVLIPIHERREQEK